MTARRERAFAAIDVGTNATRLKVAHVDARGVIKPIYRSRDEIRPGEGVFTSGAITAAAVDRLVKTLLGYAETCLSLDAEPRAVATSALRDAQNQQEVLRRVADESGLRLDVISGREEARLILLGVLQRKLATPPALLIDIGGGSTEVAFAKAKESHELWSIGLGSLRLKELFQTTGHVDADKLSLLRRYVERACDDDLASVPATTPAEALGTSGSIRAFVGYAAPSGKGSASLRRVHETVNRLATLGLDERAKHFGRRRAEVIVVAGAILEGVMRRLSLTRIHAVDAGLRDGVLLDLWRRHEHGGQASSIAATAVAYGRRLRFDERHAEKVASLSLSLFDDLESLHRLPRRYRPVLHAAALLHDVGYAVNAQKHHRHTSYLIENADLPGLTDRERTVAARLARFHRRRPPVKGHPGLVGLLEEDARAVRRLTPLLRLADALDRAHHQKVERVVADSTPQSVTVRLHAARGATLEIWDARREAPLFRSVYGRALRVLADAT